MEKKMFQIQLSLKMIPHKGDISRHTKLQKYSIPSSCHRGDHFYAWLIGVPVVVTLFKDQSWPVLDLGLGVCSTDYHPYGASELNSTVYRAFTCLPVCLISVRCWDGTRLFPVCLLSVCWLLSFFASPCFKCVLRLSPWMFVKPYCCCVSFISV